MSTRTTGSIVAAAAAAFLVAGCGSNDASDHAGHSSESVAAAPSGGDTTSTDTTSTDTTGTAAAAPTADELTQSLELLVAPDIDAVAKASEVENGQARLTNFEAMTAALANYGEITFDVGEPTVQGETATAQVAIATPRSTADPTPNTWVLIDGDWKVSETSACALLAMGQAPCV